MQKALVKVNREDSKPTVPELLLKSSAITSLRLETDVYDAFMKRKWDATHSPYYVDLRTDKLREIDVTARKLYGNSVGNKISCEVVFLVECKSINDYHIIASNRLEEHKSSSLIEIQLGNERYKWYERLTSILKKHFIHVKDIRNIIQELNHQSYPDDMNFFNNYRVSAFELPVFNAFRETNIGTTKDLETSVVWKAFQSLSSCIDKYLDLIWEDIAWSVGFAKFERPNNKIEDIKESLLVRAQHVKLLHPVLVLESALWELNDGSIKPLNYFRLIFQKLYDDVTWIDVVNKDHLDEYLEKAGRYEKFYDRIFKV